MKMAELSFKGTFRDYQQKILDESQRYLEDGKIHIVAAPGSGKTILGLELICSLGKPALILAPSITIRQQWGERFAEAFLPEGKEPQDYVSYRIAEPKSITCITYQALYAAMSGKEAEETEEEASPERTDYQDLSGYPVFRQSSQLDVVAIIKKKHITTICLDEAHHLRSEWHSSVMRLLEKLGERITVISLTATPPYDSTPAEWQKYIDLCGPIDAEISAPQLVAQKTLCPHQDLVYFSYPTETEQAKIRELKQRASQAITDVMESGLLIEAFSSLQSKMIPEIEDWIYQHIEEFRAFLYCVKLSGGQLPQKYRGLVLERKKAPVFSKNMAQLGCQFVVDNPSLFGEDISNRMLYFFRERHVTEQKRINVTSNKDITSLLTTSMGKLEGIQEITKKEVENLGDDLRMVILTDYIKKNLKKLIGSEESISEMGTVPIFESLRREQIEGAKLGLISGSLTILPDSSLDKLGSIAKEQTCGIKVSSIKDTGFSQVEFAGGSKKKVNIVTELFRLGKINILIGTKSLLGEGWDSPCINSLILASFVGSFLLSNQMRGRAIRVDKENSEKVSIIWHLVTPEIEDKTSITFAKLIGGKAAYDKTMTLGADYETVARRFECFMAPSLKEDCIESGIARLGINRYLGRSEIVQKNKEMLVLSENRSQIRESWTRSLAKCESEEYEICQKNEFHKAAIPTGFGFFNLSVYLILMIAITILDIMLYRSILHSGGFAGGILAVVVLLLFYVFAIRGIYYVIRLLSPRSLIEAIARAVLHTFQQNGTIRSNQVRLEISGTNDGLYIYTTLRGGTLREKQQFAETMKELLSPMDNPRYVVLRYMLRFPQYYYSLPCPSLIGNNRENVEVFEKELRKQIGKASVVYVRNDIGHQVYRKCVKRSFVNYKINENGVIVRKEVF